jgi:hypothetical protein
VLHVGVVEHREDLLAFLLPVAFFCNAFLVSKSASGLAHFNLLGDDRIFRISVFTRTHDGGV